jgi:hypothetical protein
LDFFGNFHKRYFSLPGSAIKCGPSDDLIENAHARGIPTGFRRKAQGWGGRADPGGARRKPGKPQGSSFLATLGWRAQSLQD